MRISKVDTISKRFQGYVNHVQQLSTESQEAVGRPKRVMEMQQIGKEGGDENLKLIPIMRPQINFKNAYRKNMFFMKLFLF